MQARLQFFAFHKWFSGYAGSFGMAPDQFVRIEVGGVAEKEVQRYACTSANAFLKMLN